jgi:CRISPR/Cas system CSM-associated protein Csm2 small subunit
MPGEHETETASVKVSMRDIYLEVQRQGRLLEKIANSLPDSEDKIEDHENRIRVLERRMWQAIGIFGLLAAASPFLSSLIP